ncbi:Na+/H+ antiporter family protein [Alteribacillus iranensis]|uniref:Na+/H+ antiporter NhaC n=1 Tax=Alteribacillus iranensis TaxID=930128 RepID=A0A1I2FCS8_9BACI|nr:Na+/H+ antiporter NhaC family protein [Alteribacillus iranensis]SFF02321.1 hypothetical protein SAMN05192532_11039 [Alteribacillus iranensis]
MITVISSVLVMIILSLLRVNVVLAVLAAGITAGLISGLGWQEGLDLLISGMGGQAETALSYILLGVFAVMIGKSGITGVLVSFLLRVIQGRRGLLIMIIAAVASLSQNVVPVHIAFIPILIPPLLKLFNELKIDRRAVASALTFGLKAPYVTLPVGFGFIYHNTIASEMTASGLDISVNEIWKAMVLPGAGMVVGLFIAVFITYRKPREYASIGEEQEDVLIDKKSESLSVSHIFTIIAIIAALVTQIVMDSLIFGALAGIVLMFLFKVIPFKTGDETVNEGVRLMGMIAFVMLIASGFATVLQETGAVDDMVEKAVEVSGSANLWTAAVILLSGLVVTLGIGTSFGTVPILAALFVPFCMSVGFSPLATVALIGTAGAMGDAGSPASDSTLGPTAGLKVDGKHHHIWDTCVPTFLHYNIPLFLFGLLAAMVL